MTYIVELGEDAYLDQLDIRVLDGGKIKDFKFTLLEMTDDESRQNKHPLTASLHSAQDSISIVKTGFNHYSQVIDARAPL